MQQTRILQSSATKALRQLQPVSPAAQATYLPHLPLFRLAPTQPQAVVLPDVFTPPADRTVEAENAARLTAEAVASYGLFSQTRDASALSRAIALQREALTDAPVAVASQLSNMGTFLTARYILTRSKDNLERSIELKQRALDLTPTHQKTERAARLGNLAASYGLRFQASRSEGDLDRAIDLQEQALAATPATSALRPQRLEQLATALTGKADLASIDRCIAVADEALRLAAEVTKQAKLLSILAFAFAARAKAAANASNLDKAIELSEEALRLQPVGHADRPARLSQLASVLRQKWALTGHADVPALQRSYALDREAKHLRAQA